MVKRMLINAIEPEQCRVAVVENRILEEFYTEGASVTQLKGNIYKGVVSNIEPSLQACFVDFGAPMNGFLQIDEIHPEYFRESETPRGKRPRIHNVLSTGQELLVQVVKDASGQKRPTLTTYLSIVSRYVVLMPGRSSGGVSRKIEDEQERKRLREIMKDVSLPEGVSMILRTAAVEISKRQVTADAKSVLRLWEKIRERGQQEQAPCLIYGEQDLVTRFLRDHFSPEIVEVVVDDRDMHRKAVEFIKIIAPRQQKRVKLYKGREPLFAHHGLESQIESIYEKRVPLPSGGGIVVEPTEALITIDVNSGKATREQGLEDTAFHTNLEAADEIVRQLRLRDLGGLVVIDFIDMREKRHQKEVLKRLRDKLKDDRARTKVGSMSRFGLVELSRQRMGMPIQQRAYVDCPRCKGRGVLKTPEASALSHFRRIWHKVSSGNISSLEIRLPVDAALYLLNQKRASLVNLETRYNVSISVVADPAMEPDEVRIETSKREGGA